jgi:hypothetical protein
MHATATPALARRLTPTRLAAACTTQRAPLTRRRTDCSCVRACATQRLNTLLAHQESSAWSSPAARAARGRQGAGGAQRRLPRLAPPAPPARLFLSSPSSSSTSSARPAGTAGCTSAPAPGGQRAAGAVSVVQSAVRRWRRPAGQHRGSALAQHSARPLLARSSRPAAACAGRAGLHVLWRRASCARPAPALARPPVRRPPVLGVWRRHRMACARVPHAPAGDPRGRAIAAACSCDRKPGERRPLHRFFCPRNRGPSRWGLTSWPPRPLQSIAPIVHRVQRRAGPTRARAERANHFPRERGRRAPAGAPLPISSCCPSHRPDSSPARGGARPGQQPWPRARCRCPSPPAAIRARSCRRRVAPRAVAARGRVSAARRRPIQLPATAAGSPRVT